MDEIRKIIAGRMAQLGISAAELSRKLNKNHAYMQQFLTGKQQRLSYEHKLIIAEILDVPPQKLGIAPQGRAAAERTYSAGFSQDAVPYVPASGHFLTATPAHFLMLTQVSNALDQHDKPILKGDVCVFDLNKSDPATIKPLTVVAVQMCDRAELGNSFGSLIRLFLPPNKLLTNSSEMNEIISLDDDSLPFIPVIKGSLDSSIRGLN